MIGFILIAGISSRLSSTLPVALDAGCLQDVAQKIAGGAVRVSDIPELSLTPAAEAVLQDALIHVEGAVDVDVENLAPVLVGPRAVDRLADDDAGIIDHDVGGTDLLVHALRQLTAGRSIGHIERAGQRLLARVPDLARGRLCPVLPQIGHDYLRAGSGDAERDGTSDPLPRPRHHDAAIVQQARDLTLRGHYLPRDSWRIRSAMIPS